METWLQSGLTVGDSVPVAQARQNHDDTRPRCSKCGFPAQVQHHITYNPIDLVWLCNWCHSRITSLNSKAGVVNRAPLDNELRKFLWDWFISEWNMLKYGKRVRNMEIKRLLLRQKSQTGI